MNRRDFLKKAGLLGATGMLPSLAVSLAGINEAAAFSAGDYKALVCVFLRGGNDHANTLIPIDDANFATYQSLRSGIALPRSQILPLSNGQTLAHNTRYGLHPKLVNLQKLFNQDKKLAVLQNVGMILRPTTKADYQASLNLPPKLFSHNDQMSYWESHGAANERSQGWGGKIGRLAQTNNLSANRSLTCISTSGKHKFLSTTTTEQFVATRANNNNPTGIVSTHLTPNKWWMNSQVPMNEAYKMLSASRTNIYEKELSKIFLSAYNTEQNISTYLTELGALKTTFASDTLAEQLATVVNIIRVQSKLGMKRQVFLVSLSGFDTHDNQLTAHDTLMSQLDGALASFYSAMQEIGMANQVTAFTASEFGRTFVDNGNGTDHGWGGHHFILGGAVKGGYFYGTAPKYGNHTDDDVGQGRLIPTTSVDQYAATLAKWFGVPDAQMSQILPYINNFGSNRYLGFL